MVLNVRAVRRGATCEVKVQPGAGRTAVAGVWDGALKLKVAKKPEAGAANRECLRFMARGLGVPVSMLCIIKGEQARRKVILAERLSAEEMKARLEALLAGAS